MVAQFEAGALDVIRNPPLVDFDAAEEQPDYQAVRASATRALLRDRRQHAQRRRSTTSGFARR